MAVGPARHRRRQRATDRRCPRPWAPV